MTSPRLRRWAAVGTLTVAGLLAGTGIAAAHVTVTPTQATQGGYGTFTFKVPNESATADTIKIEIKIPADTPVPSVSYQPVPGWTATTTEAAATHAADVRRRRVDQVGLDRHLHRGSRAPRSPPASSRRSACPWGRCPRSTRSAFPPIRPTTTAPSSAGPTRHRPTAPNRSIRRRP